MPYTPLLPRHSALHWRSGRRSRTPRKNSSAEGLASSVRSLSCPQTEVVPVGFDPPTSLATNLSTSNRWGPQHNQADHAAWMSASSTYSPPPCLYRRQLPHAAAYARGDPHRPVPPTPTPSRGRRVHLHRPRPRRQRRPSVASPCIPRPPRSGTSRWSPGCGRQTGLDLPLADAGPHAGSPPTALERGGPLLSLIREAR